MNGDVQLEVTEKLALEARLALHTCLRQVSSKAPVLYQFGPWFCNREREKQQAVKGTESAVLERTAGR